MQALRREMNLHHHHLPHQHAGVSHGLPETKKSKFFSCFSFFFFGQNRKLGMHTIIFQMVEEVWIKYKLAIYIFLVPMKTGYLSMKVERVQI